MNSFTSNLTAADMVAHHLISERVADAQSRAQGRAEIRRIRAARKQSRRTPAPQTHDLPVWAARFMFPAR